MTAALSRPLLLELEAVPAGRELAPADMLRRPIRPCAGCGGGLQPADPAGSECWTCRVFLQPYRKP